ncbi:MAG: methyltransferase domain-containing protein [Thaumarchaeota archaeon]|nr:methyltransferase domain-containing protein [Nitrososphaerota archaeon]
MLEETKEYYRQRAAQYSDWANRTGNYEGGSEPDESWFSEARTVIEALEAARLDGDVLEVACGTGIWTDVLVKNANSVTALDSSQEMIERSKARLKANPKVRFVLADFYGWLPDMAYDAVTFSFWISHVPSWKLDEFASKVSKCLKPEGRVFFVDQRREAMKYETLDRPGGEVATRTLDDGRQFKVVKHFYSSEEIGECFMRSGIRVRVMNTPTHFFYASGQKLPEALPSSAQDDHRR